MLTSVSPSTCPVMNNTSYTAADSIEAFCISCNVTFDGTLVAEYALSDVYSCIDIYGANPSACVGTKYVVSVPYFTYYLHDGGVVVDSNGPDWVAMLDPMQAGIWKVKAGPGGGKVCWRRGGKGGWREIKVPGSPVRGVSERGGARVLGGLEMIFGL
jgi:hypothetical protein